MRRRSLILVMLLLAPVLARTAEAQRADVGVRMIRAWTDPEVLAFGVPGTVHLELRVAPGVALFLPDTLHAATEMASIGTGRWVATPLEGDSAAITATYPVIGYREGIYELPKLELAVATRTDGLRAPLVLPMREAAAAEGAELARAVVPLGSATIGGYEPLEGSGVGAAPRPPAD
ncbi:MAG TPA: hypothetical protein VMN39_07225, partial [Longimicrobiaceae bacterium]|nr:hypothetical protein [Longimicrobiaceae bacterium]